MPTGVAVGNTVGKRPCLRTQRCELLLTDSSYTCTACVEHVTAVTIQSLANMPGV
jgi:hypothetical protein